LIHIFKNKSTKSVILLFLFSLIVSFFSTCSQPPIQPAWPEITQQTKPWTRWWWMGSSVDKNGLTAAMETYQKAGLGGLEITPIYGVKGYEDTFITYLSSQWMDMLRHTLHEGQRLDLGIDMATGTGWPFGGPFVEAKNASRYMAWRTFNLTRSQGLDQLVKYTQDPLVRAVRHKVDISELGQPLAENKNLQELALDQVRFEKDLPLQAFMAFSDDNKVVELTPHVDRSGQAEGSAYPGNWDLYALFSGWHGKMVERAAPGGEGYVIDHFSRKAVTDYLNHFDKAFAQTDIRGLRAFFNDSYEVDDAFGQADWTPGFFEDFRRLRGYDLRNQLKDLYSRRETERSQRILCDYRETISDLLLTEFTENWAQWAESKNAITRNQAHGSPANILDLYAASGIPETEGDDLLGIKLASSAANVSGKKLTSAETATWLDEHFLASLGDVKKTVDLFFLGGVNHVVYHGTTYSPQKETWPGWMFYASVHFGLSNSFWKDFHILNNYVARSQSFLQNSRPDNDILLYFPYYDLISQPGKEMLHHIGSRLSRLPLPNFTTVASSLHDNGYTMDYISDRQIKTLKCEDDLLQTHKSKYKAIVIPETHFFSLETFEKILDLAENGATIIIHNNFPADVKGFGHMRRGGKGLAFMHNSSDSLQSMITRLKLTETGDPDIKQSTVGKGKIIIGPDLPKLLSQIKIKREILVDNGLQFIRKNYGEGKVYFIKNPGNNAIERWIPLQTDAVSAALFNPMNNSFGKADFRHSENGNIEVFLQLQPSESIILQTFMSALALETPYYPYIQPSADKKEINGNWTITFIDGGPVLPEIIKTSELESWTNLGDENTKSFSGSAEYIIDLDLDKKEQNDLLLELGQVCESAVINFNDIEIASLISSPYQCIIPAEMIKEKNQLKIIVTNLMANRIAHLDKQNTNWKKFYNINFPARLAENRGADGLFTAKNWQPLKSGLLGPVTLTPVEKVQFELSAQELTTEADFEKAIDLNWKIAFEDDCTDSWQKKWVMDGERSHITHSAQGMDYFAGTEAYNDTGHTVLWTKQTFSGDLKIEYDYTRLDTSRLGVNIIYLLATGSGKGPYKSDLFEWNELRRVPAMRQYFNHVNTYHISYAAYPFESGKPGYIRARRYMPETGQGLDGTALTPEYENSGFFAPGVKHHIIVIRRGEKLYMQVSNPTQSRLFWFETSNFPPIEAGRVGLRHMWTRAVRYANFKISELK
jgi:hypothetical protein